MATSPVLDNMKRATQSTIDGFNKWDYEAIEATRSEDFIYQFLPLSLGSPPRNNEQYREVFASQLTPAFQDFKVSEMARYAFFMTDSTR